MRLIQASTVLPVIFLLPVFCVPRRDFNSIPEKQSDDDDERRLKKIGSLLKKNFTNILSDLSSGLNLDDGRFLTTISDLFLAPGSHSDNRPDSFSTKILSSPIPTSNDLEKSRPPSSASPIRPKWDSAIRKGRTFAQLIPLTNDNSLLSGISFVVSNAATFFFVIFVIGNVISLLVGKGREFAPRIASFDEMDVMGDPKTWELIKDIPQYLEYADLGHLINIGFDYFGIKERDCQMRTVCEAQNFLAGRSETIAMVVKSFSSFSNRMEGEILEALDNGHESRNCSSLYDGCKSSLMEFIFGKIANFIREKIG
ncbi:Uncharacterised protein g5943 [Pycnogonum litorale]